MMHPSNVIYNITHAKKKKKHKLLIAHIQEITLDMCTFFDGSLFDAAAYQSVIGCLVANDIQQERHLCRVAEGDFGHHCSLKRITILHRSVSIQEVTVLLIWQYLSKIKRHRFLKYPCIGCVFCERNMYIHLHIFFLIKTKKRENTIT